MYSGTGPWSNGSEKIALEAGHDVLTLGVQMVSAYRARILPLLLKHLDHFNWLLIMFGRASTLFVKINPTHLLIFIVQIRDWRASRKKNGT